MPKTISDNKLLESKYSFPVIIWIIITLIQVLTYPEILFRFIPIPAAFLNSLPVIAIFILVISGYKSRKEENVSQKSQKIHLSEVNYFITALGFTWSLLLLVFYFAGTLLDKILYDNFFYATFHLNLHSLHNLRFYSLAFLLFLYFED